MGLQAWFILNWFASEIVSTQSIEFQLSCYARTTCKRDVALIQNFWVILKEFIDEMKKAGNELHSVTYFSKNSKKINQRWVSQLILMWNKHTAHITCIIALFADVWVKENLMCAKVHYAYASFIGRFIFPTLILKSFGPPGYNTIKVKLQI